MAVTSGNLVIARDLVRVSQDRSGREKSPDDQHAAHERTATRMNWELRGPSYRDIGSASEFAAKARADFDRLIKDLQDNKFDASVLMMWENARGSRQEGEWLQLINLAKQRRVKFWVEVRGRLMDPADPHDRRDLVHAAADAAFESNLLSERTRRGTASSAEDGLPHGPVPYGYQRLYNERTRLFVAQELHPDRAPVIKELFVRIYKGHSLRSIELDFKARGVEKASGGPFSSAHLRKFLINPAYMGERVHDTLRAKGSREISPTALRTKAVWPPIVSRSLYRRVQEVLADPARKTTRPGGVKHVLSGIAVCGVCGNVCRVRKITSKSAQAAYACAAASGCARVPKDELEQLAYDVLIEYLADPANYSAFKQPGEEPTAELDAIAEEIADAVGELNELRAALDANQIRPTSFAQADTSTRARLDALRARDDALRKPSAPDGVIAPGADVATRWKKATFDEHRMTYRAFLVPELVGQLRISPVGRGRWRKRVPIEDLVTFRTTTV